MKALLQRVSRASVDVDGERIAQIAGGLLVLLGVERDDASKQAERMAQRLLAYRVFEDDGGRMNRSLCDTGGDLLLVSQFTLAADTRQGNRAGFSSAAEPEKARELFDDVVERCRLAHEGVVQTGRFQADMQVALVNDGPVSFVLSVE